MCLRQCLCEHTARDGKVEDFLAVSSVQAEAAYPSKHETLTRCWANDGPPSTTLIINPTLGLCVLFAGHSVVGDSAAYTGPLY